ncbi:MAG: DUF2953 domain-containing protein [Butyricicoccaceae bacterium]
MAEIALAAAAGLLKLVLILLAVLVVLGVITLFIRLRFVLHSERGVLQIRIGAGPFLFRADRFGKLLDQALEEPPEPKEKEGKKGKKKSKSEDGSKKKAPKYAMTTEEAVELLMSLLEDLRGLVDFPVFRLDAVIATKDPARTGILLGQTAVLVSNLYPFLVSRFDIRDPHIWVDGDFEAGHRTTWVFDLEAKTRIVRFARFVLRRQDEIIRLARWMRSFG